MLASPERKPQAGGDERAARTSRPGWAVVVPVVASIMFGVLAGLTLRWGVPVWWTLQAIGALGAVAAGLEHRRRRSAALRGAATGLIAALAVVCVRALVPGEDVVSFDPVSFPLVAAVASAGLHAVGAALRRRATAASEERPVLR
jgi:CHASE2 domain-containing sensor protein